MAPCMADCTIAALARRTPLGVSPLVGTLLALGTVMVAGCEPPASDPPPPAATASAEVRKETPKAMAPPGDLEVSKLQEALKCADDAASGACGVLTQFATCKAWDASVPSGDGRWIGKGYRVVKGAVEEEFTLLRARRVPLDDVGPGQLPVKVGISAIPTDHAAYGTAQRAVDAFSRHDVPPNKNPAVSFVNDLEEWPEAYAIQTVGKQVYVAAEGGGFLCMGPKQQVLLVKKAATRGTVGDGLYAELWATTW
jgi:hypothetical protein